MTFSIITPTYNRVHTLPRLFESLIAQTHTDFEWLIIDDGSTDNTSEIVTTWSADFPIKYESQIHQGQSTTLNHGVQLAKGELCLIVDSDDALIPKALEIFHERYLSIPEEIRSDFVGVCGLRCRPDGRIVGNKFPRDVFDSTSMDIHYRHRIWGDKCRMHRTEVLRQFPIMELKSVTWNAISRVYKTRFVNEVLLICHFDSGNQITKQTFAELSHRNIFYAMTLNNDIDYLFIAPLRMLKIATRGVHLSLYQSDSLSLQLTRLTPWRAKCLWILALPLGMILYLFSRIHESLLVIFPKK